MRMGKIGRSKNQHNFYTLNPGVRYPPGMYTEMVAKDISFEIEEADKLAKVIGRDPKKHLVLLEELEEKVLLS